VSSDLTEPNTPRYRGPDARTQIEGLEALRSMSFATDWVAAPTDTKVPNFAPVGNGRSYGDPRLESFEREPSSLTRAPQPPKGAATKPAGTGERVAGRHHSSQSRGDELLRQHGDRFASFSLIGGGIFVAGLAIQAVLTGGLHVASFISYIVQAVVSVEASFLLNRWLTWRGVKTPFWSSFWRYNAQKVITVTANLILYAGLLKLGLNYLVANILLTIVFTFVNYVGADKFVFLRGSRQLVAAVTGPLPIITGPMPVLRVDRQSAPQSRRTRREMPSISVVIPVRSNEATIRAAVESILRQDYPMLRELLLVGSPGESTWSALRGIDDPRLFVMETETPPGVRDANFKRDLGIRETSADLVSLIDSDMVIPPSWMSDAVQLLMENEVDCVAGVMRSIRDDFWGRFVDGNRLGAKTPRATSSYLVTAEGFGAAGYKPPITADILFTRTMYEDCPIDGSWSHGSLEDYEWFWRVVERGHKVLVSDQLFGWHHHRAGFRKLSAEYRRSARGCAYFIRAHRDSPFAQKRMSQAIVLPLGFLGVLAVLAGVAFMGDGLQAIAALAALGVVGLVLLSARELVRTRTLESLVYPIPGLILGLNYTASLATHLIRNAPRYTAAPIAYDLPVVARNAPDWAGSQSRNQTRLRYLLILILALQSAVSLSLVRSNTAFTDEAEYLWAGHLQIAHWLHGMPLPLLLTHTMSGSPVIYPPIGAAADSVGGLIGARLLSLVFMLISTILLYSVARQLIGENAAICATALWAISEPTIHLGAFATYDALSVLLTALSVWLSLRAATRSHRGEYVAAAAAALALANAAAYSGVVMDPVVIAFVFFSWTSMIGIRRAAACAGWLLGALLLLFAVAMTMSRSWPAIIYTIFLRGSGSGFNYQANTIGSVLGDVWSYSGLYLVLSAIGYIVAFRFETRARRWLLATMVAAALVVPISQLRYLTVVSLDKHLAYGIWFAAMVCGYGCQRLIRRIPGAPGLAVVLCGALGFAYFLTDSWQAASYKQLSWGNSAAFVNALRPIAAAVPGKIDATTQDYVARYYTSQGYDWNRWNKGKLPLSLTNVPASQQVAAYRRLLGRDNYSVIALFYATTVRELPASMVLSTHGSVANEKILNIITGNNTSVSAEGQAALTVALENDPEYHLASIGPFNANIITGIFVIWEKKAP
jgi:putative flippase GtrA